MASILGQFFPVYMLAYKNSRRWYDCHRYYSEETEIERLKWIPQD